MGYQIEGGQEETSAAGRRLYQPEKGPLAFVSEHAVVPLTEVEEAIVAWSACGPNGMAHWDIASSGGFHGTGRDRRAHRWRPRATRSPPTCS